MGKSTAAQFFRRSGFPVHDSDACVHALYAPGGAAVEAVCDAFPGVRADDGGIDRAKLSAAILAAGREDSLKRLEALVHPLVTADRDAFIQRAAADGEWLVCLDVPLLFETMDAPARSELLDAVIVVSAPADIQRERVLARPGMTEEKLAAILARQVADAEKRAAADHVIESRPSVARARARTARALPRRARRAPPGGTSAGRPQRRRGGGGGGRVVGVTFDLDDTLWPTWPPIRAASAALAEAVAAALPKTAAAGGAERDALKANADAVRAAQPGLGHDFTELRRAALEGEAARHGDDAAAVGGVVERFVTVRSDVAAHFFDDTVPSLEALRAEGFVVGAVPTATATCGATRRSLVSLTLSARRAAPALSKPHRALLAGVRGGGRRPPGRGTHARGGAPVRDGPRR